MIYAGVGSRGTPAIFNFFCSLVGEYAAMRGMALWSGDCHGPDRSFYHGQMEAVRKGYDVPVGMIWKAWPGHNANLNYLLKARRPIDYQMFSECSMAVQNECRRILFEVKPKLKDKWGAFNTRTGRPVMGNGAKALLSRDVLQVLGPMLLTPEDPDYQKADMVFLYCEEINGVPQGGTATAYLIAKKNGIPVYNFYFEENRRRIAEWLGIDYKEDFLDVWEANKYVLEPMFRSDNISLT